MPRKAKQKRIVLKKKVMKKKLVIKRTPKQKPKVTVRSVPLLMSTTIRSTAPKFVTGREGSVRIRNTEPLGYATWGTSSQTAWGLDTDLPLVISPTNASVFPWLRQIAGNFEKYKFHKLVFRAVSLAPTTSTGSYSMAVDYDSIDVLPQSMQAMEENSTCISTNISRNQSLQVDCSTRGVNSMGSYLYTGEAPAGTSDAKTYYSGQLLLAYESVGTLSNGLIKYYVDYDVELITPQQSVAATQVLNVTTNARTPASPAGYNTQYSGYTSGTMCKMSSLDTSGDVTLNWTSPGHYRVNCQQILTNLNNASSYSDAFANTVVDGQGSDSFIYGGRTANFVKSSAEINSVISAASGISNVFSPFNFDFLVTVAEAGAKTIIKAMIPKVVELVVGTGVAVYNSIMVSRMAELNHWKVNNPLGEVLVSQPVMDGPVINRIGPQPDREMPHGTVQEVEVCSALEKVLRRLMAGSYDDHPSRATDVVSSDGEYEEVPPRSRDRSRGTLRK